MDTNELSIAKPQTEDFANVDKVEQLYAADVQLLKWMEQTGQDEHHRAAADRMKFGLHVGDELTLTVKVNDPYIAAVLLSTLYSKDGGSDNVFPGFQLTSFGKTERRRIAELQEMFNNLHNAASTAMSTTDFALNLIGLQNNLDPEDWAAIENLRQKLQSR